MLITVVSVLYHWLLPSHLLLPATPSTFHRAKPALESGSSSSSTENLQQLRTTVVPVEGVRRLLRTQGTGVVAVFALVIVAARLIIIIPIIIAIIAVLVRV